MNGPGRTLLLTAALSAVVAIFLRQGRRREANQANTQSAAE
nr:hypothetical protein [Enterocloster clostridioformis]